MELTDEEKEDLKHIQEDIIDYYYSRRPNFDTLVDEDIWALENTLNLIEKQQKEIEEQKSRNKKLNTLILDLNKALEDSISKEAIRELIQNLKDSDKNDKLEDLMYEKNWTPYELFEHILKELLGE